MAEFIQIIVQEKTSDDYRAFMICRDASGNKWELRASGRSPDKATKIAYDHFKDENNWGIFGYTIED